MTTAAKTSKSLALDGGTPIRARRLPYGRQDLDERDIQAVVDVLRSDWLTTGPNVVEFETAVSRVVGAREAVAVSNGTAALHAALHAAKIGPGDEVIVPAITFIATANCVVYSGATPVFSDVNAETLLLDPRDVERKITSRTRAILAVDYAGQPCDYDALREIAKKNDLLLVADAAHSLGARYKGRPVGSLADLTTFSFHPVKHITTGEGGMIVCDDPHKAVSMRVFRNHGIDRNHQQRAEQHSFEYQMVELGFNYRLTDFQCALGLSQLRRLPAFVARRQAIAARYNAAFAELEEINPLIGRSEISHAYHLYVIRLDTSRLGANREEIYNALEAEGIGINVHYLPVYLHLFYQQRFQMKSGLCPVAETVYKSILSLPIFPAMGDQDVFDVIDAVHKVVEHYAAERG